MDLPPNSQLLPNNLLVDLGRKVRSAYGRLKYIVSDSDKQSLHKLVLERIKQDIGDYIAI